MSTLRLNHAVLYVRDVAASVAFYCGVLGFEPLPGTDTKRGAAFLLAPGSTNDHDPGLFQIASDHGTTKSLYAKDPDGLEFEVVWLIPADLLTEQDRYKRARLGPLDLAAEVARYGRDARSGIGISRVLA